ncbi:MAG: glycosyltransferase [Candidatus Latescibacteria bacterium]|nr:glycosyltransferase [bacterium]MBD3423847.1 glycosyltransferase [Candidatus Latescibacterota bacterium]
MPSILQFCAVDYTAYFLLRPLGAGLRDAGYRVTFCCSPGPGLEMLAREGFEVRGIGVSRSYNIFSHLISLARLYRYLKRESFDIVHTHTPVASLIGRLAAKLAGVGTVIYTAHGFYFHEGMGRAARKLYIYLEKIGGRLSDLIFVQSMEDYVDARREGIAPGEKLVHIGNGIDPEMFGMKRYPEERARLKKEFNINDQPVVGFVGRMVREKGVFDLVRAAVEVKRSHENVRFILIGEQLDSGRGGCAGELRELIRREGLSSNVIMTGRREDVPSILTLLDIFVLPSYREGMPRSILEAMASSLPVVASNIRGSREEVVEGETGLLFPAGDFHALAGALRELLDNPGLARKMGERGREKVLKCHNEENIVNKQIESIGRVAAAGDKSGTAEIRDRSF